MLSDRKGRIILAAGMLVGFLFPTCLLAETAYFVMGEEPLGMFHYDSYVLALDNPDDIAHARDLIQYGPSIGAALAEAKIMAGPDGINRDWLAPGKPLWNWHIVEFVTFNDAAIPIIDGWPGLVAADPDAWIERTRGATDPPGVGTIAFWTYTVIAEIVPEPAADGDLDESGTVDYSDVLLALRIAVDVIAPTPIQILRGDVSPAGAPDGIIDMSDTLIIARKVFGLVSY